MDECKRTIQNKKYIYARTLEILYITFLFAQIRLYFSFSLPCICTITFYEHRTEILKNDNIFSIMNRLILILINKMFKNLEGGSIYTHYKI